jgi:hypothetical protein
VNCFSTKDTFLKYFYQTVNSITGGAKNLSASGVTAIPVTSIQNLFYFNFIYFNYNQDIENVDVSSFVTSHVFYAKNQTIAAILNFVDVGGVECNRNYNATRRKSLTPLPPSLPLSSASSSTPFPTEPSSIFEKLVQTIHSYIPHNNL